MNTEQKVAVITGASQGIGAALVKAYRDRNYRVVAISRSIQPSDDDAILAVSGDIADRKTAERAIAEECNVTEVDIQLTNLKENKMSSNSVNRPNMKLEVVVFSVSDVDRAKAFYEKLGWRFDIDIAEGGYRNVHVTPPNSDTSIIFGTGVTPNNPGAVQNLVLAVDNLDAARKDLSDRGVNVSEIFHYAGGPFNNAVENPRVSGRDPQDRSYFSFASFDDPDGNLWLLQEITTRFPGRLWDSTPAQDMDVATLATLLRETAEHHDPYEKTHAEHDWWDWYAPYLSARQNGSSPEESAAAADRYMEEVVPVLSK